MLELDGAQHLADPELGSPSLAVKSGAAGIFGHLHAPISGETCRGGTIAGSKCIILFPMPLPSDRLAR